MTVERFIADQLARWKPTVASVPYRYRYRA
jgi:hypothetical protein